MAPKTTTRSTSAKSASKKNPLQNLSIDLEQSNNDSKFSLQQVPIDKISLDPTTQSRAELSERVVEEYAELMSEGANFPPVEVYFDGTGYWVSDGFHRIRAARRCGKDRIQARVYSGTQRDALMASLGANASHGLRRSNRDKRRAVEIALRDPEWKKFSDNEIARLCSVTQPFVSKISREIYGNDAIGRTRESLEEPDQRLAVRKSGTVHSVATDKINRDRDKPRTQTARPYERAIESPEISLEVLGEELEKLPEKIATLPAFPEALIKSGEIPETAEADLVIIQHDFFEDEWRFDYLGEVAEIVIVAITDPSDVWIAAQSVALSFTYGMWVSLIDWSGYLAFMSSEDIDEVPDPTANDSWEDFMKKIMRTFGTSGKLITQNTLTISPRVLSMANWEGEFYKAPSA